MSARDNNLAAARTAALNDLMLNDDVPAPRWRVIITDSESPTGVAPLCTTQHGDRIHMIDDYPGGPRRDEEGVYDCCPWPQIETYSTVWATYLVALLNADVAPEPDTDFFQPGHAYSKGQDGYKAPEQTWQFRCVAIADHPRDGAGRRAFGFMRQGLGPWESAGVREGEFERGWTDVTRAEAAR